jgi:hypothetical protein
MQPPHKGEDVEYKCLPSKMQGNEERMWMTVDVKVINEIFNLLITSRR